MSNVIIYGSCYGTTRSYAEELAKRTEYKLMSCEDVGDINSYETIVYMGGLYAGGVQGMKKTLKKLSDISDKRIIILTVGLADPTDKENVDHIRDNMKSQLSKEIYDKALIFHLRGGIDYSELSFLHKTMMGMMYKKVKAIPEEEQSAEVKAMIETYNKQVDFVDFETLEPVIKCL